VARAAQDLHGYAVLGACPSPIPGAEGNREFFLHLRPHGAPMDDGALEALVTRVVAP
jgi:hypothetical protein